MKSLSIACLFTIITCNFAIAQQKVLSYPFEFEKSILATADYDAFVLDNIKDSGFAIVLKDNRKAAYALFDKNFNKTSEVPSAIDNTIFKSSEIEFVGGTTAGNRYHFFYKKKSDYYIETVDYDSRSVSNQKLFEIPKGETSLASFSDNNVFYAIAANDQTSELVIYAVNEKGNLTAKNIPLQIPEDAGRGRRKLSTYLKDLTVIKSNEEPELSTAINKAKLFSRPESFEFIINDGDKPARIIMLTLPDYRSSEKFVSFEGIVPKEEKEKPLINSFLKNNKLFSVVVTEKNLRIVAHDLITGSMLTKYEINKKSQPSYAQIPVRELREGKRKSIVNIRKFDNLILAMQREGQGIMISEDQSGKLILTIGSFHYLRLTSSHWTGSNYMHGYVPGSNAPLSTTTYRLTISEQHYITSFCRFLLDQSTLKIANGASAPVAEQVKNYIETVSKKAQATNQFVIGKKQYYGYYDREKKSYIVDRINIK